MGVGSTIRLMGCCEERAEVPHEVLLLGTVTLSLSAGVLRTVGSFMPEVFFAFQAACLLVLSGHPAAASIRPAG